MELISKKPVTLHLIDENFLFLEDIREKYSWKDKYEVKFYTSIDKFLAGAGQIHIPRNGIHIVILAVNLALPDKQLTSDLIDKFLSAFPGIYLIKICHKNELEKEVLSQSRENVFKIVNNENTLLRIDNAIKWVLAKKNIEKKSRLYKIALYVFLASLVFTSLLWLLVFLLGS